VSTHDRLFRLCIAIGVLEVGVQIFTVLFP